MFGRILNGIIVAELIGAGVLGALVYSEIRYRQGRHDAYVDVQNKLCELLKDTNEKHESEQGES